MSPDINPKEIERKAYLSYHEDGLIDIIIGAVIVLTGLFVFALYIAVPGALMLAGGMLVLAGFLRRYPIVNSMPPGETCSNG